MLAAIRSCITVSCMHHCIIHSRMIDLVSFRKCCAAQCTSRATSPGATRGSASRPLRRRTSSTWCCRCSSSARTSLLFQTAMLVAACPKRTSTATRAAMWCILAAPHSGDSCLGTCSAEALKHQCPSKISKCQRLCILHPSVGSRVHGACF